MSSTDPSMGKILERLERDRYVSGQLLTADDFRVEQDYFRKKLRRHNLLLHGWGIVFGLNITPSSNPWRVMVEPGYAIDQEGEEIVVDVAQGADAGPHCHGQSHCELYIAIRYRATEAALVTTGPTAATSHNEQEAMMQYSRWVDGFQLALLGRCPTWAEDPLDHSQESGNESPWVVLGQITADSNGTITVRSCPQRRNLTAERGR